ncbi:hypothetical protein Tco_1079234 [Tanacetum coccineum]|uniref:Uncharacterized protein n=1 Tax=Tanacetum coccineum TaxID=301880 RepID=A0ABQ5HSK3_9ASTR
MCIRCTAVAGLVLELMSWSSAVALSDSISVQRWSVITVSGDNDRTIVDMMRARGSGCLGLDVLDCGTPPPVIGDSAGGMLGRDGWRDEVCAESLSALRLISCGASYPMRLLSIIAGCTACSCVRACKAYSEAWRQGGGWRYWGGPGAGLETLKKLPKPLEMPFALVEDKQLDQLLEENTRTTKLESTMQLPAISVCRSWVIDKQLVEYAES